MITSSRTRGTPTMISNALIIFSIVIIGMVLFHHRVSNNPFWRATITPLASIIGSGFLILGPILSQAYGGYAPLVMIGLCLLAFAFGAAIRANITSHTEPQTGALITTMETLSSWVLAFAYIISVAYYLNLFGAFGVRLAFTGGTFEAKLVTSGIFIFILFIGWTRGFAALERMEQVSVSLKLAIIVGLIVGLALFTGDHARQNQLIFNPADLHGWPALTLAFGLIVTIQGFEISRYLGDAYSPATRISSMRFAQYISSAIYVTYITLIAYVFAPEQFGLSETSIIDMMHLVAPILPALLIIAALSAQFSAAVADTSGSGGLISELTDNHVKPAHAYAILAIAGLVLTWTANIFEIVSYASRAFALYYGLQAAIAALFALADDKRSWRVLPYGALALLGFCIAIFGTPVET